MLRRRIALAKDEFDQWMSSIGDFQLVLLTAERLQHLESLGAIQLSKKCAVCASRLANRFSEKKRRRQKAHEARRQRGYPAGSIHGDIGAGGMRPIRVLRAAERKRIIKALLVRIVRKRHKHEI